MIKSFYYSCLDRCKTNRFFSGRLGLIHLYTTLFVIATGLGLFTIFTGQADTLKLIGQTEAAAAKAQPPDELPLEPLPITGITGNIRFQTGRLGRSQNQDNAIEQNRLRPIGRHSFTPIGEALAQKLSVTVVDKATRGIEYMQSASVDENGDYSIFDMPIGNYFIVLSNRSDHPTVGNDSFVIPIRANKLALKNFKIADEPGDDSNRRGPSTQAQLEEALLESILFIRPSQGDIELDASTTGGE